MNRNKPDYSTSIVQVKANEVIPPVLLRKLAEQNPSAFGMVIREPTGLVVEKFHHLDDLEKNLKFLQNIQDNTKKYPGMFCFHDFPTESDEDEVQPYKIILDSKGNPLLVVAVEGDFTNRENPEFSEAHMLVQDWLGPKIEDMYKLMGNSPQKLYDYLHSAQFQNDFKTIYGHRAAMGFMPTVGDPFVIEHNEIGLVGTWGSASNVYGYTESALEAASLAEPEKATPQRKMSKYASDVPQPEPKPTVAVPKVEPAPVAIPEEKVAAAIVAEAQPEEIDWAPPAGVHGKPLKQAYRAVNAGVLPDNWRERPTIRIKAKGTVKSLKELDQTKAKDMQAAAPKPVVEKLKVFTLPIISGVQQAKAVEMIKKYLGDGSAVIDDPVKANEQEAKLATFSQLVLKSGKLEELDRWTTAFIFGFTKENPETAALAIIELRAALRNLRKDAGKTLGELTGTETPAQVEVQPEQPAKVDTPAEPLAAPGPKKSKYA